MLAEFYLSTRSTAFKTKMCTEYKQEPPPPTHKLQCQEYSQLTSATENEKICVIFVAGNRKAFNL